jgi:hypothetical protein
LPNKIKSNYKNYISFCDSYLDENYIAQWIRLNYDTVTFTLQHGQYKFTKSGNESNDSDAYENFVSHYIFVWGESTKKEFIKANIPSEKIIVAGSLKPFTSKIKFNFDINGNTKLICVALDGDQTYKSNINLLEIIIDFCRENGFGYYLRFHPRSNIKFYKKYLLNEFFKGKVDSITMYQKNISFMVLHTSGVIIEAITNKIPFFLYIDNLSESIHYELNRGFINKNNLLNLSLDLNNNYHSEETKLTEISKNFNIAETIDQLKSKYRIFIKGDS